MTADVLGAAGGSVGLVNDATDLFLKVDEETRGSLEVRPVVGVSSPYDEVAPDAEVATVRVEVDFVIEERRTITGKLITTDEHGNQVKKKVKATETPVIHIPMRISFDRVVASNGCAHIRDLSVRKGPGTAVWGIAEKFSLGIDASGTVAPSARTKQCGKVTLTLSWRQDRYLGANREPTSELTIYGDGRADLKGEFGKFLPVGELVSECPELPEQADDRRRREAKARAASEYARIERSTVEESTATAFRRVPTTPPELRGTEFLARIKELVTSVYLTDFDSCGGAVITDAEMGVVKTALARGEADAHATFDKIRQSRRERRRKFFVALIGADEVRRHEGTFSTALNEDQPDSVVLADLRVDRTKVPFDETVERLSPLGRRRADDAADRRQTGEAVWADLDARLKEGLYPPLIRELRAHVRKTWPSPDFASSGSGDELSDQDLEVIKTTLHSGELDTEQLIKAIDGARRQQRIDTLSRQLRAELHTFGTAQQDELARYVDERTTDADIIGMMGGGEPGLS